MLISLASCIRIKTPSTSSSRKERHSSRPGPDPCPTFFSAPPSSRFSLPYPLKRYHTLRRARTGPNVSARGLTSPHTEGSPLSIPGFFRWTQGPHSEIFCVAGCALQSTTASHLTRTTGERNFNSTTRNETLGSHSHSSNSCKWHCTKRGEAPFQAMLVVITPKSNTQSNFSAGTHQRGIARHMFWTRILTPCKDKISCIQNTTHSIETTQSNAGSTVSWLKC